MEVIILLSVYFFLAPIILHLVADLADTVDLLFGREAPDLFRAFILLTTEFFADPWDAVLPDFDIKKMFRCLMSNNETSNLLA